MVHPRNRSEPEPVAIVRAWCGAAGPEVARVAFPRGFVGGRLQVVVSDGNWLRELEGYRQRLLERLRQERGMSGLVDIVLQLEPSGTQRPPGTRRSSDGPTQAGPIPEEILAAAEAIPDREMARRLASAAGNLLARAQRDRRLR